jgi:release factor glutamine methyltransferase
MKANDWLIKATRKLEQAGIATARLDSLVLLEDVTAKDRGWLLAHPETRLDTSATQKLDKLLTKRAKHIPLAYVRGKTEFYGHEFVITPAVLEPRPESETMLELLKNLPDLPAETRLADVGAGSGAIGISAQIMLPETTVDLLEIDKNAIKIAQKNVDLFTLNMQIIESDLLKNTNKDYSALLCNLPYVPDRYQINLAALHEPQLAIFGGNDGLDIYRRLFSQAQERSSKPLYILCESLPFQHDGLQGIAGTAGYKLTTSEDFIQVFKLAE